MRVVLCLGVCTSVLAAQSLTTAIVSGSVEDSSGGIIKNSTVTAWLIEKNQRWTSATDDSGRFRFAALAPGNYKLTAAANGFETVDRELTLTVGQDVDLRFSLPVAGSSTWC